MGMRSTQQVLNGERDRQRWSRAPVPVAPGERPKETSKTTASGPCGAAKLPPGPSSSNGNNSKTENECPHILQANVCNPPLIRTDRRPQVGSYQNIPSISGISVFFYMENKEDAGNRNKWTICYVNLFVILNPSTEPMTYTCQPPHPLEYICEQASMITNTMTRLQAQQSKRFRQNLPRERKQGKIHITRKKI